MARGLWSKAREARSEELQRLFLEQSADDMDFRQDLLVNSCISLEDAGLEEPAKQITSIPQLVGYLFDGEDSRYETN